MQSNRAVRGASSGIICPKCGTPNPVIQQVYKKRNPLMVLLYIALVCIPVIGWIVLFINLAKREKTEPMCTCQSCAYGWLLSASPTTAKSADAVQPIIVRDKMIKCPDCGMEQRCERETCCYCGIRFSKTNSI